MKKFTFEQKLALCFADGITPAKFYQVMDGLVEIDTYKLNWYAAEQGAAWQNKSDRFLVMYDDSLYPSLLKQTVGAPPVLFIEGNVEVISKPQVAMVGSRKATSLGVESAYQIAQDLTSNGFVVTSGLARGIDTSAHLGALYSGQTVAVLGTGIDITYPKSNQSLRDKISKSGAIVSEFELNMQPKAYNFPRRNRIISGLSLGVIVVEAQERSGSLISARYALEQNREVMAMPGSAGDPKFCGCNKLLKQGAALVENIEDVLNVLGIEAQESSTKPATKEKIKKEQLSNIQEKILNAVDRQLTPINLIQKRTNIEIQYCLTALSELAWLQLVEQVEGGFVRKA